MDKDDKVWELDKIDGETKIVDTAIIKKVKDLDVVVMTKCGIYVKEETYIFVNFIPDLKGDFEVCLRIDIDDLPEDVVVTDNKMLMRMYRNGFYKALESAKEDFDLYVPTNHGKVNKRMIFSHICIRDRERTLTGTDIKRINVLDTIEFKNIRLLFIDRELYDSGKSVEMQFPNDVFIIDAIPHLNEEGKGIKEEWDNYYHEYNYECSVILAEMGLAEKAKKLKL